MEKAKVEKTKVKVLGTKIKAKVEKVGTRTIGIKATGTDNGTTKAKERTQVVSLSMEINELPQLRIPKLRVQTKPRISLNPRSLPCLP